MCTMSSRHHSLRTSDGMDVEEPDRDWGAAGAQAQGVEFVGPHS